MYIRSFIFYQDHQIRDIFVKIKQILFLVEILLKIMDFIYLYFHFKAYKNFSGVKLALKKKQNFIFKP